MDWLQTYQNGKFENLAKYFEGIDGSAILGYTIDQFVYIFNDSISKARVVELYNVLHPH